MDITNGILVTGRVKMQDTARERCSIEKKVLE